MNLQHLKFCSSKIKIVFDFTSFNDILSLLGWIVSTSLAGATIGSFTGGSLADKFGRTRTFQLDAIPLAVGAFLWFVLCPWLQVHEVWIYSNLFESLNQRHSTECTDNDNWPLTCWHWNWYLICSCATLYIWGSYIFKLKCVSASKCLIIFY